MGRHRFALLLVLMIGPACPVLAQAPAGPEQQLNTYTAGSQVLATVSSDGGSVWMAAWASEGQDGSGDAVIARRYDPAGTPLGPEFQVNTYILGEQRSPSVACAADRTCVVVWQSLSQDGSGWGVYGQRFDSAGAPRGPEFRINDYTSNNQENARVATDAKGNFVVVWQSLEQDGSEWGIYARRYSAKGAPRGSAFRVNTTRTFTQFLPAIDLDPAGNFVVAWATLGDGIERTFARRYRASGAPIGGEFDVSNGTEVFHLNPSVALDATGVFVIAWDAVSGDGSLDVYGRAFDSSGAPQGDTFVINTYDSDFQFQPWVSKRPGGEWVAVWQSRYQDGSLDGVFGQRFDADGAMVGAEFQVNTHTSNDQAFPVVASDAEGNLMVVWSSFLQDGDAWGGYGQLYLYP